MAKSLTIFTPAYNRAHTLSRTYESLCRQTSKDFEWLVVDDGSSDHTGELVKTWIDERKIDIRYIYQENQGMHGAHNTAYRNIHTELNTCIDSDDYMPDDAVEKIVTFWKANGSDRYAGLMGLDYSEKGGLIGKRFPAELKESTLSGYYLNGGLGDKKVVYRTAVTNQYPEYPRFGNEKYLSLGYKYLLIDQDYTLLTLNECLVIVDYQLDGSSFSMWKQYWNNPNGWMFLRKTHMKLYRPWRIKVKSCIHYVSHCIRAGRKKEILASPMPVTTLLVSPIGALLYLYNKRQVLRNQVMHFKQ